LSCACAAGALASAINERPNTARSTEFSFMTSPF